MQVAISQAGQLVGGRYRLIELAGVGGMAEVWRAELEGIEGFRRTVAVKRILKHLSVSKEHREMFVQEARLTATLDHPNIVHVYDFGEDSQGLYLVLEWVEGLTVRELIQLLNEHGQQPSAALATAIGIEVLKALEAAHENAITMLDGSEQNAPIIHRDVSPSNVLLSVRGITKLADFGLARAMHSTISSMTPAGIVKGKLAYMAPEILRGKPASGQTDVYSTGVLLWELLSCRRMFKGDGDVISALMSNKPPTSIRVHRPDLPEVLADAVDRALLGDTEQRFASAGDFARGLADVLRTIPERTDRSRLAREMKNALIFWRSSEAGKRSMAERGITTPAASPAAPQRPGPPPVPKQIIGSGSPEPSKQFLDLSFGAIPMDGRPTVTPRTLNDDAAIELSGSFIEIDFETAIPLVETVTLPAPELSDASIDIDFEVSDPSVAFELAALRKKP
ncbi:MAG: serine/threonine-protein kinase [Deltaproteobacteria bacterium]|nr:serine/threonine-protein kinase [Deltaproteobacteria bacterium]